MSTRFLTTLTACLLLVSQATAADPVELRYKGEAEQQTPYRSTTKVEQAMEVNGQDFKTSMELGDVSLRSVERVTEAGDLRMKTANKRITVQADMGPAGKYKFDSKDAEHERGSALSEAMNPAFEAVAGAEVRFTLSPLGEVTDVDGYAELMKQVLEENPAAAAFTGGGSDQAFAVSMEDALVRLPKDPVRVGDTWEADYELDMQGVGKIKGKRTYKLEELTEKDDRQVAKISLAHSGSVDVDLTSGEAKVTGKISVTEAAGTVLFDVEAGQTLSTEVNITMSGDLTTTVAGQTITTSLKQTQKTTSTRLDKLPE